MSEIEKVLIRAVAEILPDKQNLKKLMQKKKIRVYLGIDPTAKRLHLGHTINLRKLQEFANLGHEAILVIGTGTVLVGDPSLRDEARKQITKKEIKENVRAWRKQLKKVVNFSKIKIRYNGKWLRKLNYEKINEIASHISSIQLYQRDSFQRRIKRGDTVWTNETLYPLMQGYDSVYLDVDLEIGGTDQIFNMLIGRDLQRRMNDREKFVLTSPMIVGTDGNPMSKTTGNCIWIDDSAEDKYGKIMSIPDNLIDSYAELLTRLETKELNFLKSPRDKKARVAKEIVRMYHGGREAEKAEAEFAKVFKNKELPTDIPEIKITEAGPLDILELLVQTKLVSSKAEARRLVEQKAVKIDNKIESNWQSQIKTRPGLVIQVGKRRFAKIK